MSPADFAVNFFVALFALIDPIGTVPLFAAAKVGVYLHGRAGDLAAQAGGERGLLATDLLPLLRQLVNP